MGCIDSLKQFGKNLLQTKQVPKDALASDLRRVLGLLDLTYLSIGAMIGVGVYVTMGQITLKAGPSIVVSYFLAGIASILSALCYAELGARIPIAGSSYQFTYLTMGEFLGFFVGWNIALEHAIGSAAVAEGVSGYIDSLFGNVIKKYLAKHLPMPGGFMATYPDFLAVGYVIMIVILIALGIKLSSRTNIFFATLNLVICSFIIISAMIIGSGSNWTIQGHGGFFPHGFPSTLSGAATLIFAYIGYEVVGAAAEEAENPRRNIPLSLMISIGFVTFVYVTVSASFVSLGPWYDASSSAPFSEVYARHGWYWAKYVITVGIIVATNAALIATTLAVPRYLFSMARDGLLPEFLAKVNQTTGVPVIATIVGGVLCVLLVLLFGLVELIDFMSIGQLIACIFVAVSIIKLRYKPFKLENSQCVELEQNNIENVNGELNGRIFTENSSLIDTDASGSSNKEVAEECTGRIRKSIQNSRFAFLFNWTNHYEPGNVPVFCLFVAMLFSAALLSMLLFGSEFLHEWWFITLAVLFALVMVCSVIFISLFTEDPTIETYKIPLSPFSPFISIVINLALMMKLDVETWMRLGVWMAVGLLLYFGYGYSHSKARSCRDKVDTSD